MEMNKDKLIFWLIIIPYVSLILYGLVQVLMNFGKQDFGIYL